MTEAVITDLETGLREVFRRAYLRNCEIEGEELTESDKQTLEDLDSLEILENFKDLVESLLSLKQDFKHTDKSELVSRCEQFEAMLQKLEADVRTHIRVPFTQIEQQLKLHADATQAKLEELEEICEQKESDVLREALKVKEKEVEDLKRQSLSTFELLAQEENAPPLHSHRRVFSQEQEPEELKADGSASRLYEIAQQRHKIMLRLEKECMGLKLALDKRGVELERVKVEYERTLRELQLLRIKKTQESLSRKRSEEKQIDRQKNSKSSLERPLTDRQLRKSSETEKKSDLSAYKNTDSSYNSKSKLEPTAPSYPPEVTKKRSHARILSERMKRPMSSMRGHYKV